MFFDKDGSQGIAMGVVDGVIAFLGTTIGITALPEADKIILLAAGLGVGISNGIGTATGFFLAQEVEKEEKKLRGSVRMMRRAAFATFVFAVGVVLLALIPYLFMPIQTGRYFSIGVCSVILAAYGAWHATRSGENKVKEAFKFWGLGMAAALLSYFVGTLLGAGLLR